MTWEELTEKATSYRIAYKYLDVGNDNPFLTDGKNEFYKNRCVTLRNDFHDDEMLVNVSYDKMYQIMLALR